MRGTRTVVEARHAVPLPWIGIHDRRSPDAAWCARRVGSGRCRVGQSGCWTHHLRAGWAVYTSASSSSPESPLVPLWERGKRKRRRGAAPLCTPYPHIRRGEESFALTPTAGSPTRPGAPGASAREAGTPGSTCLPTTRRPPDPPCGRWRRRQAARWFSCARPCQ